MGVRTASTITTSVGAGADDVVPDMAASYERRVARAQAMERSGGPAVAGRRVADHVRLAGQLTLPAGHPLLVTLMGPTGGVGQGGPSRGQALLARLDGAPVQPAGVAGGPDGSSA